MRVLTISTRFNGGGAERAARETCLALVPREVEPTMFTCHRQPNDPPWVRVVRNPWEKYLRALIPDSRVGDWRHIGSRIAMDAVKPGEFDLVHIHSTNGGWISVKALARLAKKIPTVWTLHDEWAVTPGLPYNLGRVLTRGEIDALPGATFCDPTSPYGKAQGQFLRRALPRPAAIIVPSRYLHEMAEGCMWFAGVPVVQIPYGLPMADNPLTAMPRLEARRALGLPDGAKVAMLVAANFQNIFKGLPRAIEALRHLVGSGTHLLVVGECGSALPIDLPTTYTGFLKDDDALVRAYRAADVTLVPSIADNFPFVALESLACSTPIVTFDVGGLPEIVGDNARGLMARHFDTEEYARHVHRLLNDDTLRIAMGERCRRWVQETCDARRAIDRCLEVYHRAVGAWHDSRHNPPV